MWFHSILYIYVLHSSPVQKKGLGTVYSLYTVMVVAGTELRRQLTEDSFIIRPTACSSLTFDKLLITVEVLQLKCQFHLSRGRPPHLLFGLLTTTLRVCSIWPLLYEFYWRCFMINVFSKRTFPKTLKPMMWGINLQSWFLSIIDN